MHRIEVTESDITTLPVDVVVTAANPRLAGGGGVDGAVHRAAGPRLLEACHAIGGCPTGDAVITDAFDLPARWVIHAVGPVWSGGTDDEPAQLASCYRRSLELAVEHEARTIAFPAISCGVYGYPVEAAARIAVASVTDFLAASPALDRVLLACFEDDVTAAYESALARAR